MSDIELRVSNLENYMIEIKRLLDAVGLDPESPASSLKQCLVSGVEGISHRNGPKVDFNFHVDPSLYELQYERDD